MLATSLLALQVASSAVAVTASVDRARVPVGDEVIYSLRAVIQGSGPVRAELPQVSGLEVLERTERLDPVLGSDGARAFVLDVRLRAAAVGVWRFGPVLIFVGGNAEFAPETTVTVVTSAAALTSPTTNPRLLALVRRVPPPSDRGEATLVVLVSDASVVRGEQLDVLTAAWFPRSVRARLRRPPTLKPPVLTGVWSVPQAPIPGVVASLGVGDESYDLFVSHQVVYPLAPGPLTIPPARVEYALPISRRSASSERPVEIESPPVLVDVRELPEPGRPAGFVGPVASDLAISYRLRQLPARVGDLLPIEVAVTGGGNLTFWPPPVVDWPAGTRAYLDRTDEDRRPGAGLLGGTRTFRYLLLPDSVGSVALPALRYAYFDPLRRAYREAETPGVVVPVLEPAPAGRRRDPVPLATVRADWPAWAARFVPGQGPWLAVVCAGLASIVGIGSWRWGGRRPGRATTTARPSAVESLDRVFLHLVGDGGDRQAPDVMTDLRRAGIDRELAARLIALRTDADRVRFGPGPGREEAELTRAAAGALSRLPARLRRRLSLGLFLVACPTSMVAGLQSDGAARFREGAFGPAAQAFRAEAAGQPAVWQHWYHVAAAEYQAGRDARAAAALLAARDLAPRAPLPRRLWEVLQREHEPLRQVAPPIPLARGERWLAFLGLAWIGSLVLLRCGIARPAGRMAAAVIVLALLSAALLDWPRWTDQAFTASALTLRLSPHGLAPERGAVPGLSLIRVEDRAGDWVLVRDRSGARGWVPRRGIALIGATE